MGPTTTVTTTTMTSTTTTGRGVCCCIILSAIEPTLLRDWRLMTFGINPHIGIKDNYKEECEILGILADLGFYLDPKTKFIDIPRQGPAKLTVRNVWSSYPDDTFQLILTNPRALFSVSFGLTKDARAMKEIIKSQTILPKNFEYNPILLSDEDQASLARLYGLSYINWRSCRSVKPGSSSSPLLVSRHSGEYRTIVFYPPLSSDVQIGGTLINPRKVTFSIGARDTLSLSYMTLDHLESSISISPANQVRSVQSAVSRIDNTRRTCTECDTTYYAPAFIANTSKPQSFEALLANTSKLQTFEKCLLTTDIDHSRYDTMCFDIAHTLTHIIDVLVSDKKSNPVELLFGNGMSRPGCRFLWVPPLNITHAEMCAAALTHGSLFRQDPILVSVFVLSSRLPVSVYGAISGGLRDPDRILGRQQYLSSMTVTTLLEDAANLYDRLNSDRSLLSEHMVHPSVKALLTAVFGQSFIE
nr:MAG: hypothetical protein [Penaeus semisulcatus pemonivirus]